MAFKLSHIEITHCQAFGNEEYYDKVHVHVHVHAYTIYNIVEKVVYVPSLPPSSPPLSPSLYLGPNRAGGDDDELRVW